MYSYIILYTQRPIAIQSKRFNRLSVVREILWCTGVSASQCLQRQRRRRAIIHKIHNEYTKDDDDDGKSRDYDDKHRRLLNIYFLRASCFSVCII